MPFVYCIKHKNHKDIKTEGYVGVTLDFRKRIIKHISVSNTQKGDMDNSA